MASVKDDRGYNQEWQDNEATTIRLERRCEYAIQYMDTRTAGKAVLEIGCGTGKNCYFIATKTPFEVLGTDICVPFIETAKETYKAPNLRYDVLDFNKVEQFNLDRFDYIVGNGILHHLYYHLDEALVNMRKLLKPEGKMIFWEPNLYNPYVYGIFTYPKLRKIANLEPDEMAFSKPFIHAKLEKAGYKNMDIQFRDFLLPGIPKVFIKPSIAIGGVVEQIPLIKMVSQSLFIVAENGN